MLEGASLAAVMTALSPFSLACAALFPCFSVPLDAGYSLLDTLEDALEREGVWLFVEETATVLDEEGWCACCCNPPPLPGETRLL